MTKKPLLTRILAIALPIAAVFLFGMGAGSLLGPGIVQTVVSILAVPLVVLLILKFTLEHRWHARESEREHQPSH
ncbi:hypothetical protein [Agrococcus casei]|uniref:hypothetical protein n=1 Tax=Agrococcus casei TaxID=343512 RepID=UPI003F910216